MKRLIDADALKYEPLPKGERNYRTYNLDDAYEDGYHDAFVDVMNAPTIDAEPVRHGKWIHEVRYTIDSLHSYQQYRCSECGMTYITNTKYCPNCGARMDAE